MSRIFRRPRPILAMVHAGPTPGAPGYRSLECTVGRAIAEAKLYAELGVDGILIENMHDFPCIHERDQGPEVAAYMTRVAVGVKRQVGQMPVGVQVLFQGNKTALAVALAAQCDFIRAEGWTHAGVTDKGETRACGGDMLRYRRTIDAEHIPVFCDLKTNVAPGSGAVTPIDEMARLMDLHRADGIVVCGAATGQHPTLEEVQAARAATHLPLLVGNGVSIENLEQFSPFADGFIVGSALKEGGRWEAPVCEDRVRAIVEMARIGTDVLA